MQWDLDAGLRRMGFDEFRPGQREAIETVLSTGRLLLVAPTGGGKSLTYQLPAALLDKPVFVVSPLIALMHDQVHAMNDAGIAATYLASTLGGSEVRQRMREIGAGVHKLVYVAPERLVHSGFRGLLMDCDPAVIAIDEAHCISEWGHDFRPEYMRIGEVLDLCPDAKVLACTATATPVVRDEILSKLGLPADTPQILRGFARPNLALSAKEILSRREGQEHVDRTLSAALGDPGAAAGCAIVYAGTRAATEREYERLVQEGWLAEPYHAGMSGGARDRVLERFRRGDVDVVVATNAFGMGIDRADVRAVIHLAPPGSIEAYYQEVGRAGRDGLPAQGLLMTQPRDLPLRRQLIESDGARDEVVDHKWQLFLELMRWVEGGSCRHDAILRYFGDEAETLAGCGLCDVCRSLDEETRSTDEVTVIVRKALSGVARIHGRFGLSAAVALLRGAKDPRLERAGLNRVRTFGVLSEFSEAWLQRLLRRCVTAGWVDFVGDDRPVAALTQQGVAVMKAEAPARMLLPSEVQRPAPANTRKRRQVDVSELSPEAATLFEALRSYRLQRAKEDGVPPYVVASDRSLRDIAALRPRNVDELQLAHGIGQAKAEKYGDDLLQVVAVSANEVG